VNEFSYIDIFATKGFEYLLVIGFFLLLAGFWSFLNVPKKQIRKAQEEREELRRLLDLQRERMESELNTLRGQRETMQNTLLTQLQLIEQRATVAWNEVHAEENVAPELGGLLDWVLAERDELVQDKKRLDYLTELVQWKTSLYRTEGSNGSLFVVDAAEKGLGEGASLRGAIDAARAPSLDAKGGSSE
jgi:hypothetical protein